MQKVKVDYSEFFLSVVILLFIILISFLIIRFRNDDSLNEREMIEKIVTGSNLGDLKDVNIIGSVPHKIIKEIEGAGQQQLRNFWANIGSFHLNMWVHTMVELWAWDKPVDEISDRSDSPWDKNYRRPSHAGRYAGLRREIIAKTFFATSGHNRKTRKIVRQFYKLMKLAS